MSIWIRAARVRYMLKRGLSILAELFWLVADPAAVKLASGDQSAPGRETRGRRG